MGFHPALSAAEEAEEHRFLRQHFNLYYDPRDPYSLTDKWLDFVGANKLDSLAPNYDAPELRRPIYDASRQGRRHRGPGGDPERSGAIRSEAAPVIAARRRGQLEQLDPRLRSVCSVPVEMVPAKR